MEVGMSRMKARGKPRPVVRDVDIADLAGILERARTGPLDASDVQKLQGALDTLVFLTQELRAKGTSLQRLRNMLFGATTEKSSQVLGSLGKTDGTPEVTASGAGPAEKEADKPKGGKPEEKEGSEDKAKPKGHGRNGAAAYTGATKVHVAHPSLHAGECCPLCAQGKVYQVKEPSVLVRVKGMAPLSATVFEREQLRCNGCGEVFTAPSPEGVGDEKYDESATAMVGESRYGTGVPFNRLEKLQDRMGIPLPASTQWDLAKGGKEKLAPVHEELVWQAAQGEVLHNDDTTMRVRELGSKQPDETDEERAKEPDAKERTGVFTTGIVAQVQDHKVALFMTGRQHAGENLQDVLEQRSGRKPPPIQMCDALSRNVPKDFETLLGNCLVHARRTFVEEIDNFPEECTHVIEELRKVFRNDKTAREQGMSPQERLRYHQRQSGPVLGHLKKWMRDQVKEKKVEPNSGVGEAIRYMQRHWRKLTLFLRVAGAPLENNICERVLKMAIMHRKNSMFYLTLNGAHVGDVFMSLIFTAELNQVNSFDYLVAVLRNHKAAAENPEDWLPWNYTANLARIAAE